MLAIVAGCVRQNLLKARYQREPCLGWQDDEPSRSSVNPGKQGAR
jgi:hypothetical protein